MNHRPDELDDPIRKRRPMLSMGQKCQNIIAWLIAWLTVILVILFVFNTAKDLYALGIKFGQTTKKENQ